MICCQNHQTQCWTLSSIAVWHHWAINSHRCRFEIDRKLLGKAPRRRLITLWSWRMREARRNFSTGLLETFKATTSLRAPSWHHFFHLLRRKTAAIIALFFCYSNNQKESTFKVTWRFQRFKWTAVTSFPPKASSKASTWARPWLAIIISRPGMNLVKKFTNSSRTSREENIEYSIICFNFASVIIKLLLTEEKTIKKLLCNSISIQFQTVRTRKHETGHRASIR